LMNRQQTRLSLSLSLSLSLCVCVSCTLKNCFPLNPRNNSIQLVSCLASTIPTGSMHGWTQENYCFVQAHPN
jgi:hypothetical protein